MGIVPISPRGILTQNLPAMQEWLDSFEGFFPYNPHTAGAFYFVKYDSPVLSYELVQNILHRQSTLIVPSSHLGLEGFLRIWMGGTSDFLTEGRRRIGEEIASPCRNWNDRDSVFQIVPSSRVLTPVELVRARYL